MKTIVSLLSLFAFVCHAQLIGGFSGGDDLAVGPGTAGYSFTVGAQDLTVQGLGLFDASGSGLQQEHSVGIWNASSHSIVASAIVDQNATFSLNNFWYVPIAPITLQAGTTYRIGASYADVDFDTARGNATSVTVNGATFGDAYLSSGNGFEFPDVNVSGANHGFFGANAAFAPVPEPSGALLVGSCLVLVCFAQRWYKAKQNDHCL